MLSAAAIPSAPITNEPNGSVAGQFPNYQATTRGIAVSPPTAAADVLQVQPGLAALPTAAFSLSAWVYLTAGGSQAIMFKGQIGLAFSAYSLQVGPCDRSSLTTNGLRFLAASNYPVELEDPGTLPLNQWVFVCGTTDGRDEIGVSTLYVNGVAVATTRALLIPPTNTVPLQIGGDTNGAAPRYAMSGPVLDARIYSRCLTASEVKEMYDNPWQLFAPRRIWVPQANISGVPTLSAATLINITSTNATPRVTLTF